MTHDRQFEYLPSDGAQELECLQAQPVVVVVLLVQAGGIPTIAMRDARYGYEGLVA